MLAAAAPVLLPLIAIVALAVAVVIHLYRREGQLPVFDLGVLTILMTAVYSAVPLLGFWLAGLEWTQLSYLPLYLWNPGPREVGAFSLRHLVYLYAFTATYLVFRGRVVIRPGPTRDLRDPTIAALLLVALGLSGYFWGMEEAYGVSYDPSYSNLASAPAAASARIPYFVLQMSHNLFAILFLVKLCALVWLMSRWRDWRWRTVLLSWIIAEGITTVMRMGARTWFAMLLLASVLLYHRLVKPLPFARAIILVATLLGGVLVYGVVRDLANPAGGVQTLRNMAGAGSSRWATMNEFQAIYGIAYDLYARHAAGRVGHVPWQIHAGDFLLLIPSQMLPFTKADPCVGYPLVDGQGVGCVLGVIALAVVGLDWVELVVRAMALGLAFAVIHRWYARRQDEYWPTVFYLCLCLWCYYTFRASTFYFVYYVVYRFVPLLIAVRLTQMIVRRGLRAADACGV